MTLRRKIALLAALAAMGLVSGQSATARTEAGHVFGALAYNGENDAIGWSYNYADSDEAEKVALNGCAKQGAGCYIVITFSNSCAAVTVDKATVVYSMEGPTKDEAQKNAMGRCEAGGKGGCQIKVWSCSFPGK